MDCNELSAKNQSVYSRHWSCPEIYKSDNNFTIIIKNTEINNPKRIPKHNKFFKMITMKGGRVERSTLKNNDGLKWNKQ